MWEVEIEWVRGGYLGTLTRDGKGIYGQHRDQNVWEVVRRLAYAAVIYPMRLN